MKDKFKKGDYVSPEEGLMSRNVFEIVDVEPYQYIVIDPLDEDMRRIPMHKILESIFVKVNE